MNRRRFLVENDLEHEPERAGEVEESRVDNDKESVLCGSNDMARETCDKMRKCF